MKGDWQCGGDPIFDPATRARRMLDEAQARMLEYSPTQRAALEQRARASMATSHHPLPPGQDPAFDAALKERLIRGLTTGLSDLNPSGGYVDHTNETILHFLLIALAREGFPT